MSSRLNVLLTFTRGYFHRSTPKQWKSDGVKYGLITYYPRHPNHKDPPIVPSKLFMVLRVKPFKGQPYWHKAVLTQIGFNENMTLGEPVICKNTPDMCQLLWSIKHLIKIVPIKLPEKLPKLNELTGTYLHENGTFHVIPKIDQRRYEATVNFLTDKKKIDGETMRQKLRLKWLSGYEC